ncbi:RNA-directed DNA polymerase (Reverse transcriptase), partial [Trifolium medium]|nr:RNA-directed DNA polymerase (Reverse transcriptase) [Trifolium medium]
VEMEISDGSGWSWGIKPRESNQGQTGRVDGSDWVFVKGGAASGTVSGNGPKSPNTNNRDTKPGGDSSRKGGTRDKGFTHLPYHELVDRKKKGLCYKCGGPYHPLHQCPDKHLRVMIIDDDDGKSDEAKLLAVEVTDS